MAEARVDEALQQILAGARLERRECLGVYNGADGVPIREEVVSRSGDSVISRNSYGARCLNTPNVLFADIDFAEPAASVSLGFFVCLLAVIAGVALFGVSIKWLFLGMVVMLIFPLVERAVKRLRMRRLGGYEGIARSRIKAFLHLHQSWNLRLYRTPNGMRLIATHQCFDPAATEVQAFFKAVGTDPVYSRMCLNQKCFRARLTAKPWRIGISRHMRPHSGSWPVPEECLPARRKWVADYETRAASYAACRYIESLGSGVISEDTRAVVELHDQLSQALDTGLQLA